MQTQKRCSDRCKKEYHRRWMFDRVGDKSWRKTVSCAICKEDFFPKSYNAKKCGSKSCKNEYAKLHMRGQAAKKTKQINNVICIVCKHNFSTVGKSKQITCSKGCSLKNKKTDVCNRPYRKTPEFKMYHHIRSALNGRVKGRKLRSGIVGYSPKDLRQHLESQFLDGMSWDNYGLHGWHIDHIRPLCSFAFFEKDGSINITEVQKALSLDNLQPLWAKDNLRKGAKF